MYYHMVDSIKPLVQRFYDTYRMSSELPALRKTLTAALREAGLTTTKFRFGEHVVKYTRSTDYGGLNKALLRSYIKDHYPQIEPEAFIEGLYAARPQKVTESVSVVKGASPPLRAIAGPKGPRQ